MAVVITLRCWCWSPCVSTRFLIRVGGKWLHVWLHNSCEVTQMVTPRTQVTSLISRGNLVYISLIWPREVTKSYIYLSNHPTLLVSYVEFNTELFHQQSGTAMGTPVAVCYASLYLCTLEEPSIACYDTATHLYRRLIDDCFMLWTPTPKVNLTEFFQDLQQAHPNIKFTVIMSEVSVDFMDITVYKPTSMPVPTLLCTTLY